MTLPPHPTIMAPRRVRQAHPPGVMRLRPQRRNDRRRVAQRREPDLGRSRHRAPGARGRAAADRPAVAHAPGSSAPPRGATEPGGDQDIDAVLISHVHLDHLDVRSLRSLARGGRVIAPTGAGKLLRRIGFAQIDEVTPGDRTPSATPPSRRCRRSTMAAGARWARPSRRWATRSPAPSASTSRATRSSSRACGASRGASTSPCCRSGAGGRSLGPGHMDPLSAARAVEIAAPGGRRPHPLGHVLPGRPGGAARERARRAAARVRAARGGVAPEVEVRVLAPGDELTLGRVAS